jgi:hypothetical protein
MPADYKIVHTVEAAIGWPSPTKSWGLSTRFSASAETADVDKLLQNLLVGVPVDKRKHQDVVDHDRSNRPTHPTTPSLRYSIEDSAKDA